MSPSLLGIPVTEEEENGSDQVETCAKYARIGETDHVSDIEDQGQHHDGDESATYDKSDQNGMQGNSLDSR